MVHHRRFLLAFASVICCLLLTLSSSQGSELLIGTASAEITPPFPVAVTGQFQLRIAQEAETPLTANVVALESRSETESLDSAIMVSCDLVAIPTDLLEMVRAQVSRRVPDLDTTKIFLCGTHTHTAPVLLPGVYSIPREGVTQVEDYHVLFAQRVAEAIAQAWERRQKGSVTWGLSHAAVAYNRRTVYADGSAVMYGTTNSPTFRNLEGYEDHDINTLFFLDQQSELIAAAVNVSCTAQEVEGRSAINADFWHPVRQRLQAKYGPQLCVLGLIGAAGDQSPHLMYRQAADERMRELRGLSRLDEIARRIVQAVDDTYDVVKKDLHGEPILIHKVARIQLPMRLVTESEYAEAQAECEAAQAAIAADPKAADQVFRRWKWYEETTRRFEDQQSDPNPVFDMELHVVRIGDAVVCTNAFELFTDYGIRIKARSKAQQTFVVQLAGPGSYLPTEEAVHGGGYSAIVHSSLVGPEGGQILVDRTVELIDALWAEEK